MIKRSNPDRYEKLLKNIRTQHSYRQGLHPTIMEKVHDMLNKYEFLSKQKRRPPDKYSKSKEGRSKQEEK